MIYIPLWFYSNDSKKSSYENRRITFTFHFGFILTNVLWEHYMKDPIYIPLWFYSNNDEEDKFRAAAAEFTFHFGFILTRTNKSYDFFKPIHLHSTLVLF